MTPEEEVVVLRRCIGAQQRDINRIMKRLKMQETALKNRKDEVMKYKAFVGWCLEQLRVSTEEVGAFITRKPKNN